MANLIVALVILGIVAIAVARIVYEKRKGAKCVGCSVGDTGCRPAACSDLNRSDSSGSDSSGFD